MLPERLLEKVTLQCGPMGKGDPLTFCPASVNVIVGPNHSGKSVLLRELHAVFLNPEQQPNWKVLKEVFFTPWTDTEKQEVAGKLRASACPNPNNPLHEVELRGSNWASSFNKQHFESLIASFAASKDAGQTHVFRHFILLGSFLALGGNERLTVLSPTPRERPERQAHLLSRLFYSDERRRELQKIAHDAFGWHFVIDPLGQEFEAKVSVREPHVDVERSLSDAAVEFFRPAKRIEEMSDGVRAFCGMVASVVANDARLILIDEPEAFLHPALCVKLARELCRLARQNHQQLVIATHSASFLLGCVQAGIDLNIVRMTYRDNAATSRLLPQAELVPLMRQPLLRSIGALTGIFYESVVVTESDSDRAFYDEINHRCLDARHDGGIADGLFLNAQNWQTTARIIGPLRRLGIAAAAIVDIDLLLESKSDAFQTLMLAAGMPPGTREGIGQLRGRLHSELKPKASDLKKHGTSAVYGDDRRDLDSFIDQLASYGVFVVPVGELECWLPGLPREASSGKAEWLLRTFEALGEDAAAQAYIRPTSGDVWDFLIGLRRWLHNPKRLGMP